MNGAEYKIKTNDTVIITDTPETVQRQLGKIIEISNGYNRSKTYTTEYNIYGFSVENSKTFKYLGSWIMEEVDLDSHRTRHSNIYKNAKSTL